jgi:hypothetical protein
MIVRMELELITSDNEPPPAMPRTPLRLDAISSRAVLTFVEEAIRRETPYGASFARHRDAR